MKNAELTCFQRISVNDYIKTDITSAVQRWLQDDGALVSDNSREDKRYEIKLPVFIFPYDHEICESFTLRRLSIIRRHSMFGASATQKSNLCRETVRVDESGQEYDSVDFLTSKAPMLALTIKNFSIGGFSTFVSSEIKDEFKKNQLYFVPFRVALFGKERQISVFCVVRGVSTQTDGTHMVHFSFLQKLPKMIFK